MTRHRDPFQNDTDIQGRGAGPAAMRLHNERLILGILHSVGKLSAADLSRLSGLSAQAISVILRQLDDKGLILRGAPVRGKVGQPSVPLSINPDGAFVLGAKIGRRSADLLLTGLDGRTRAHQWLSYRWPDPQEVLKWLETSACDLASTVPRVAGLGIALPFRLWDWGDEVVAGQSALQGWRTLDLAKSLAELPFPISIVNDGSAACAAEMTFGTLPHGDDVIYLFVGTFIGGGLAQRGRVVLGPKGNAGAFGSVLVQGPDNEPRQLIEVASLINLQRVLRDRGNDPDISWVSHENWDLDEPLLQDWLVQAARGIANALISIAATTGGRLAVIDGAMPDRMLDALIARVALCMAHLPQAGIDPPDLQKGTIGPRARAVGGAAFVLNDLFLAWPADWHPVER